MFKSCHIICRNIPHEWPNLLAISEIVLRLSSLIIFRTFYTFSSVRPAERRPDCPQCSTETSTPVNTEKLLKSLCCPRVIATESGFEHFICFSCSFLEPEAKLNVSSPPPPIFVIRNHRYHFLSTEINTKWEATLKVMAAKLTTRDLEIATLRYLVVENICIFRICRYERWARELLHTPSYSAKGENVLWIMSWKGPILVAVQSKASV